MHVAALVPVYPPGARFGAPLATHRLLAHLVARGHRVTVGRLVGRGADYTLDGVEVVRTRGIGALVPLVAEADVVLSHGGSATGFRLTRSARRSVRIAHGHDAADLDVDLVVCNSETLRDHLIEIGRLGGPSIVCRPPVATADHLVERTGDHVTLVSLTRDKGLKTAWDASELLPGHRFLGVKGGYGYQETPRPPNWTTWPTQPDMRRVWAETRILLMPSAYETWGMVGVEAMTNGIPVIAHPTPGLRESLSDAGIFVDRDDPRAWADEISRLDDPGEYEVASKAARKRADDLQQIFAADLDLFADSLEALCSS